MVRGHSSIVLLFFVFAALLGLLALTVEAARHDLGPWNSVVAVLIAAAKALLIALFFMHVRQATPLTKMIVAAGILWLAIMFTLSLADYWTRDWHGI
jgi:cytochrome c oxidase subunit 4